MCHDFFRFHHQSGRKVDRHDCVIDKVVDDVHVFRAATDVFDAVGAFDVNDVSDVFDQELSTGQPYPLLQIRVTILIKTKSEDFLSLQNIGNFWVNFSLENPALGLIQ